MKNAFTIIGGLILIGFIGMVFTTILMKFVVISVYMVIGLFVVCIAAIVYFISRVFNRTRME